MELLLKNARVIDINDPDKQGKIKIRILPELEMVEESLLPYAIPFSTTLSESEISNNLPLINSTIRVLVDKYWKRFYYIGNRYFYNLFDFSKVSDKLNNINDINKDYENIKFTLHRDGGLEFHNTLDSSHGYIHKSGSYILMDSDGNIKADSKANKITVKNDITDLKTILDNIESILENVVTPMNLVAPNGPVIYNQATTDLPLIKQTIELTNQLLKGD